MSMVIVYTDKPGVRSYLRAGGTGGHHFSENQADAMQFADATAANNYLAAHPEITQPTGQLTVTGIVHYGKKTANN